MAPYIGPPTERREFLVAVAKDRFPPVKSFGKRIGSVQIAGKHGAVTIEGRFCGQGLGSDGGTGCISNNDPTTQNPNDHIPCLEWHGRWYVDFAKYEIQTAQIRFDSYAYVNLTNGVGAVRSIVTRNVVRNFKGLTPDILQRIYPQLKWISGAAQSISSSALSAEVTGSTLVVAAKSAENRCWFEAYVLRGGRPPDNVPSTASGLYWNADITPHCSATLHPRTGWSGSYLSVRNSLPSGG
jgi:hypothetical protein